MAKPVPILVLIGLLSLTCRGSEIGPDLTKGTDVAYFTKLRLETARRPGFNPLWRREPDRIKIQEAYQAGDVDEILKLAGPWLKRVPIDADVHLMVAMCRKEKKDYAAMCRHLNAFYGLLSSITAEGDGLSEETAYKVVSLEEEYSLVQEIGGKVTDQSLVKGKFDRLEVQRRSGQKLTLYFDVTEHLDALRRSIAPE